MYIHYILLEIAILTQIQGRYNYIMSIELKDNKIYLFNLITYGKERKES